MRARGGNESARGKWKRGEWEKAMVILTFTWSVGFRLADCHMRHLNLVHGWRLEWGREGGWQMKKTSLITIFSGLFSLPLTINRHIFAYLCGTTLTTHLCGRMPTTQLWALVANPLPNTYKRHILKTHIRIEIVGIISYLGPHAFSMPVYHWAEKGVLQLWLWPKHCMSSSIC